jgi:glycosyltransferase involved in cell wall biosynthesis
MSSVKITVLMPAYNAERYIGQAISSVLGQTFADFDLLVVDDGSTDATADIVRSFGDPRIVLVQQENRGIAGALNTGLGMARSDLIARFDADDICYPHRLERQYRFMQESPAYLLAGSMVDYADMEGRYVFTYRPPGNTDRVIRRLSYKVCPFIHSSVIYRKEAVQSLGGYNLYAHGFEDHLLWRLLIRTGKVYNIPEVLMRVRFNPNSLTMDESCRSPVYLATKYESLRRETIHASEGKLLLEVIKAQEQSGEREQAYHVLLAKKYLWNNVQPLKAREHARKVLSAHHYTRKGLYLLLLSYLPGPMLVLLYRMINYTGYERS